MDMIGAAIGLAIGTVIVVISEAIYNKLYYAYWNWKNKKWR